MERAGKDAHFTPARLVLGPGRRGPSTNHVSRQRPDMRISGVVCWPGRRGPSTNHVSRQRPDMRISGVVCWPQVSCRRPCRCVPSAGAGPLSGQSGTISDDHTFWPSAPAVDTTVTVNGAVADVTAPFCVYQ